MILQPLAGMALELGDMLFYLLTFAILMILVGKFAWGPVTAMMEKRREQVTYDLDHAADLNKKKQLSLWRQRHKHYRILRTKPLRLSRTRKQTVRTISKSC